MGYKTQACDPKGFCAQNSYLLDINLIIALKNFLKDKRHPLTCVYSMTRATTCGLSRGRLRLLCTRKWLVEGGKEYGTYKGE